MRVAGLRTLFARHLAGLADLSNGGGGKRSWPAIGALYGLPALLAVLAVATKADLSRAGESLVGGFALAGGVLIAVFSQLAAWRQRLEGRAFDRWQSEAPARRAVDAAVAHTLVGVLVAMFASTTSVLLAADRGPTGLWTWLAVYSGTMVVGFYVLIVRSVFVAYEDSLDPNIREEDDRLLRGRG